MERHTPVTGTPVREAQDAVADSVVTELELGLTFLDVAGTTADHEHARRNIRHAITALRTADKFLSAIHPASANVELIRQRRKQLADRLRAIAALDQPRGQ